MIRLTRKISMHNLILFLFLVSVGACTKKDSLSEKKSSEIEKPIEVFTEKISKTEIFDPVFFGGVVQAKNSSPLFSAVTGIVQKIYQQPGSQVKRGQAILAVRPQEAIDSDFLPHIIRAPMDGVLARLDAQVGQLIRNDNHLGDVAKLDAFETVVQAAYQDLFQFTKGMNVDVLVAVGTPLEKIIQGKIEFISEQPEPDTGTYAVKVSLRCEHSKSECQQLLRLGSFLKVVLKQNIREGYRISKNAVHEDFHKVLVMTKNNKAKWMSVQAGQVIGEHVEIISGLETAEKNGELLVLSFGTYPKEGATLVASTKEKSLQQFIEKPVSADADKVKKPVKKG